ncbi:cytochrome P450 [Lentinus tigrinus ALCF2SS1-6]|uniref:Cytochrome P450 n=1 Tax=Lentinus tigrinus ALCF2SS1-6 TaxID=1328759 RepID=A0A5C2SP17_9APHY|nr:cytochrome P450 [Lentinus tigrinus ALCF2SS1-6]
MEPLLLAAGLSFVAILVAIVRRRRYRSLDNIRGPPTPSWLHGHDVELTRQNEAGELDFQWMKEYGATWRIGGHLGTQQLMTADPKAMQHIFMKSGYNYGKRKDIQMITKMFLGPGIVAVEGEAHQRHRKIMNPAFSAPQLRTFLSLFQDIGLQMCEKLKPEITDDPDKTVFINKWLARTTLDIIGQAAFDYDYGGLSNTESRLLKAYSNLFIDTALHPSKWLILYRSLWHYLPDSLLHIVQYTPIKEHTRTRRTFQIVSGIGKELFSEKTKEVLSSGKTETHKDVMSILIKANSSENPKTQLAEDEMVAEMQTLTFAGHETTASTLSWMLYELSKHPDYQARMRAEIKAARQAMHARGDGRFSIEDLDSMTTVMNAIKETLRFHPIVYNLQRYALKDDVLPLSEPIISAIGEEIHAIPIKAGQWIVASLAGYNRLRSVWGEDADEWNPDRFLRIDPTKQTRVGVFGNLMTFSAGIRGCIGWRFSLIEMQALSAELLENFEFARPKEDYDIVRLPAGLMIPVVRGKLYELGSVMPLRVSVAQ